MVGQSYLAFSLLAVIVSFLFFKRIYIALALLPFLISVSLRSASVFYLDIFGPAFSRQLNIFVGGGNYAAQLILIYLVALAIAIYGLNRFIFTNENFKITSKSPSFDILSKVFLGGGTIFILMLYVLLFSGDVIPLFDGVERYDFAANQSLPFHDYLFKYGTIIAAILGGITVHSKLKDDHHNVLVFILLIAIFVYSLLTGHRFAAFNKFGAFFLIPFSLLFAPINSSLTAKFFNRNLIIVVSILVAMLSFSVYGMLNSYGSIRTANIEKGIGQLAAPTGDSSELFAHIQVLQAHKEKLRQRTFMLKEKRKNQRDFGPVILVLRKLEERIFLQQGELWVASLDLKYTYPDVVPLPMIMDFLFFEPIIPDRNSSIQYLMFYNIGAKAETLLKKFNQQYAGGFPEIFVVMGGYTFALAIVAVYAVVLALTFCLFLAAVQRGYLPGIIFAAFVAYAVILTTYNGALNQYTSFTFFAKCFLLASFILLRNQFEAFFELVWRNLKMQLFRKAA